MEGLIYLLLFSIALRYIHGSLYNIINSINFTFNNIEINFYFNYLVLFIAIVFVIAIIGSIKKNVRFMKMTLIFVQIEILYILYAVIFALIQKNPIVVILFLIIDLLIDFWIIKYIKINWLNK